MKLPHSNRCQHAKYTNPALTLIELLAVIALIGILVALVFPIVTRVRQNADATRCMSNLRQIGTSLTSFAGDNDGAFPIAGTNIPIGTIDSRTGKPSWIEQIEGYIPIHDAGDGAITSKVYQCPASAVVVPKNKYYSYFFGCHAAYAESKSYEPLKQNKIQFPSKYILAGEISTNELFEGPLEPDKDDYSQNPAFAQSPAPFHGGRVALVFADGHAGLFRQFDTASMTVWYDHLADYEDKP